MEIIGSARGALALFTAALFLVGCSAPESRSALLARNSGMAVSLPPDAPAGASSPLVNFVSVVTPYSETAGAFSYYTGGASGGREAIGTSWTRVAQARDGDVGVEIKAGAETSYGDGEALRIARQLSAATREFWPRSAVPVEAELHLVPSGSAYDFSRLIRWREGTPFHLTLFVAATDKARHAHTAVHELYHVLALRWQLGSRGPGASQRPWLAHALEETTAELLAHCAELVAEESLAYPTVTSMVGTPDGNGGVRMFSDVLSPDDLQYLLQPPDERKPAGGAWQFLLAKTALKELFGANQTITLESPSATALLTLCREAAADPLSLATWFKRLDSGAPTDASAAL